VPSLEDGSVIKMSRGVSHRDGVYIRKDLIMKLIEYSRLNLTSLLMYCGLNYKKHLKFIKELEQQELIRKEVHVKGKKTITYYMVTMKGINFFRKILEPYEAIFPRKTS
jgi:predicted transcriptional regulator